MSRIAGEILQRSDTARVAYLLFHLFHTTERDDGLSASLARTNAASHPFGDVVCEMKSQFLIELAIDALTTEQGAKTFGDIGQW